MSYCTRLKTFPPISGMKKLETLKLSECSQLRNFPEIGQYCTNLISLDFGDCESLESIKGNFRLLKHLKELNLNRCEKLTILEQGLFDLNYPPVLDLCNTTFKDLFSPSLRKLSLRSCHWIKGDISSVLCELSNLQVLDLSGNDFSRLHCGFLQLCSLKVLNLSRCSNLVELPDLPESIAVLQAYKCNKLKIVDLPTNLRWLWRISLPMESISSGDFGRKVQSMLQGNAIKDNSISLSFWCYDYIEMNSTITFMLKIPRNLEQYNEFSGFLIHMKVHSESWWGMPVVITIKDVINKQSEDVLEASEDVDIWDTVFYLYMSFGSLRHTSWWKSPHTTISFSIDTYSNLKVELVPGWSKGDSLERVKDATDSLEFWNTEPIKIIRDSESCIEIEWDHGDDDSDDDM